MEKHSYTKIRPKNHSGYITEGQGKPHHSVSGPKNYRFGTRFNSELVQPKVFEAQS